MIEPIYAITVFCAASGAPCIAAEDRNGPYAERAECVAFHDERRPMVRAIIAPQLSAMWQERIRIHEVCDTLDRIRSVVPEAFAGVEVERGT
jgi:hypothetical protein